MHGGQGGKLNSPRGLLKTAVTMARAAESEEILETLRAETERVRREKQAKTQANTLTDLSPNELGDSPSDHSEETATKAAKMFNTNREYISKAATI